MSVEYEVLISLNRVVKVKGDVEDRSWLESEKVYGEKVEMKKLYEELVKKIGK